MKRLFSLLIAAVLLFGALPANATLTNSTTATRYPGSTWFYSALITATGNDTTANADSGVINNIGGDILDISAGVKATNQTGTSPTLTVSFLGSYDGSTWFALKTAQASTAGTVGTLASAALDISSASTTNVSTGISLSQFGLMGALLPPYLKVRVAVGGSSTPGWTGVAYAFVRRKQ